MSATHDGDISNQELLEAVNAGFSGMQQQMDERFGAVNQRFDSMQKQIDELRKENADEHAGMNRKLDNAIDRLDRHDRRLEALELESATRQR